MSAKFFALFYFVDIKPIEEMSFEPHFNGKNLRCGCVEGFKVADSMCMYLI